MFFFFKYLVVQRNHLMERTRTGKLSLGIHSSPGPEQHFIFETRELFFWTEKQREQHNVYLINLPCFCVVLVQVVHKNPIDLERNNMPTGMVKIFTGKCCLSSVEWYRRRSPATKDIDTVSNSCLRYELNNLVANVANV